MENNIDNKAIISKMIRTMRLHRSCIERQVSNMGIHNTQHHLLMYLSVNEDMPSQKELSEQFKVSPPAIAMSMKKLEKNGYIERTLSKEDSRVKKISITQKGKELIEKSKVMFTNVDKGTFDGITYAEIVLFDTVLDKIQNNLEKMTNNSEEQK